MTKNMSYEATVNNVDGFIKELANHKLKEKELVESNGKWYASVGRNTRTISVM